jgi:hypothetical protein
MRSPKHPQTSKTVRYGSDSFAMIFWNSATVKLRGFRTRFDASRTLTNEAGLR